MTTMNEKQKRYFKTEKGRQARRKANRRYYIKLTARRMLDRDFQFRRLVRKRFWVVPATYILTGEGC